MWDKIAEHITQVTGHKFQIEDRRSVSGGCINQGYAIASDTQTYFVKLNRAADIAMFEAEAQGLQQMWTTHTIRVPKPICWGTQGNYAYVVLEWLDLRGSGDNRAWEKMGFQLAAMHRWTPPISIPERDSYIAAPPSLSSSVELSSGMSDELKENSSDSTLFTQHSTLPMGGGFGWEINNTIGSTPQINTPTADWAEFWAKHRIGYQLQLAKRRGGQFSQGERLIEVIPELLAGHQPQPSLVHGDLWGGNASVTTSGEPVIFDPATYFGDREVDIAMTELFGGFPPAFYQGYNQGWPLDPGYQQRKTLYNLYHILNHFNLFGGGYGGQANRMIQQILG